MNGAAPILVLVKRFPKLSETFILNEILSLEAAGLDLEVRTLFAPSDEFSHPDAARVRANIGELKPGSIRASFSRAPLATLRALAASVLAAGAGAPALMREAIGLADDANATRAKLIYAHFIDHPATIARIAAILADAPFAISAHAKDIYTTPRRLLAANLKAAAFTTTCSDCNAAHLSAIAPGANVVRHYHGFDPDLFAAETAPRESGAPLILSVGRLRNKKGHDTLIEACAALRQRGVVFRCQIVGYGPEEARLKAMIAVRGLDAEISLLGKLPHAEIVPLMAGASVFALPCRIDEDGDRDGVPNVILEAMASGLPVVATDVSGVPEAVRHEMTGLLVKPDDSAALANAIARIFADPRASAQMGQRGRELVRAQFSRDVAAPPLIADLRAHSKRGPVEVAYIVKGFPRLSESFITNEILILEGNGLPMRIFALKPGERIARNVIANMRTPLDTLPCLTSLSDTKLSKWLLENVSQFSVPLARLILKRPRALLRTAAEAIAMMRRYRGANGAPRKVFIKEFLQAAYIADALIAAGGARHLHGHFCHGATTVTSFVSRITGIPFSFTAHAKDIYQAELNPGDLLTRKLDAARFVVTCTDANCRHLVHQFGALAAHRVRTIYHGLDISRFHPRSTPANDGAVRVLSVGRHVEKKGFATLIRACDLLRRQGLAITCEIVGEAGEETASLEGLIATLGLGDLVRLTPPEPQTALAETYARATIFALPCVILDNGDRDGIPNVLAEAMATGLPIVTTPVSGIPEIVEDGINGIFVPPNDEAALAEAIKRVAADSELRARLGESARRTIIEKFDSSKTTMELQKLFAAAPERVAAE